MHLLGLDGASQRLRARRTMMIVVRTEEGGGEPLMDPPGLKKASQQAWRAFDPPTTSAWLHSFSAYKA